MHWNPCVERWQLCKEPADYAHSSALFYKMGRQGKFGVRDYRDFLAVLLELEEQERASYANASSQANAQKSEG